MKKSWPRIVTLQSIPDATRGFLGVAECGQDVPFTPKRMFYFIKPEANVKRGGHAHREQHQFVITLQGAITIHGWDNNGAWTECLNVPTVGLYCPSMTWLELCFDTDDAIVVVLASDIYEEADYIRIRTEFDQLLSSK